MFVNKIWTNNHWFDLEEYECTRLGCEWDEYASDIDWGYYYNSTSDDDINKCQSRCSEDRSCGAFEWTKKYCSWWKVGKCQKVSEATISNTKFMMCRKPGILRYCNHLAFQFILANMNPLITLTCQYTIRMYYSGYKPPTAGSNFWLDHCIKCHSSSNNFCSNNDTITTNFDALLNYFRTRCINLIIFHANLHWFIW